MSSITPNMNLPVPSVNSTPGPEWAQLLNDAFTLIDQHTHATGQGVPIPLSGLVIDIPLNLGGKSVEEAAYVNLADTNTDITPSGVYSKNGELFYKDLTGNVVQITNQGSIAGVNGSIAGLESPAGALYSLGRFYWSYDSGKYAPNVHADLSLYPFDGVWDPGTSTWTGTTFTKSVTIKAPTSLESAASYTWTLPTANPPSGVEYLSIDSTGALNHATMAGTANQITVSATATAIALSLPATVSTTRFYGAAGALATPTYTFAADTNTGVFSPGADQVALVSGGTQRLVANTTGVSTTGTLTLTGPIATSGSGGSAIAHKTTIVTGALAAGASGISVFSGAMVYAVSGVGATTTAADAWTAINGTASNITWIGSGSSVLLYNSAANPRQYRLVITHA